MIELLIKNNLDLNLINNNPAMLSEHYLKKAIKHLEKILQIENIIFIHNTNVELSESKKAIFVKSLKRLFQ